MYPLTRLMMAFVCCVALGYSVAEAQCTAYFPMKSGAMFETTHYDEKDKVTSIITTTVVDKAREEGSVTMTATCKATDAKGKETGTYDYDVTCGPDEFTMDMRAMGSQSQQMKGMENIEMKIESEDMSFPKNATVGSTLPDAHMHMTGTMNGMTIMNTSITITNRKVTASENITTPAGTFSCIVIEEDSETKMMGMTVNNHSKSWYAVGAGMVRGEYSHNGKPSGYSLLTKISGH